MFDSFCTLPNEYESWKIESQLLDHQLPTLDVDELEEAILQNQSLTSTSDSSSTSTVDELKEAIHQNQSLTSTSDSFWTSSEEEEEEFEFPKEVSGIEFCYKLEKEIRATSHSYSFKARKVSSPNDFVFLKFASAEVINEEWNITRKIGKSNSLHIPFDRSPSDGVLIDKPMNSKREVRLHFIVSTYIEGKDFFQILEDNDSIDREFLLKVFQQIAIGLKTLHSYDLVHCDIKPENLMWDYKNEFVKIVDFGSSATSGSQTSVSSRLYCSPEERLSSKANPSRDIYSFGVTFFVLWAKGFPHFIDGEITNWPSDFDETMEGIGQQMLEFYPEDRPTAEELCSLDF
jgi:serine/threonine protein kinase